MEHEYEIKYTRLWLLQSQIDSILNAVKDGVDRGMRCLAQLDGELVVGDDLTEVFANVHDKCFVINRFESVHHVNPSSVTKVFTGAFDSEEDIIENIIAFLGSSK